MKRLFAVSGLLLAGIFVFGLISFSPLGVSWGHGPGWGRGGGAGWNACGGPGYGPGPGASRGPGFGRGFGPGRGAGPMHFDFSSLQTITGKVVAYETVGGFGPSGMEAVTIESDDKTLTIMLGPDFYLTDEKLSLKKGEEITVVASSTSYRSKTIFVAKSVKAGEKTLALRDEAGFPVWRGQGRQFGNSRGPGYGRRSGWGPARMVPPGK